MGYLGGGDGCAEEATLASVMMKRKKKKYVAVISEAWVILLYSLARC